MRGRRDFHPFTLRPQHSLKDALQRKQKGGTMAARKVNKLFPGRPNYTGPQQGYFAMLHHTILFEAASSTGGVDARVHYVRAAKPRKERKVRLYNMLYLGDCPIIKAVTSGDGHLWEGVLNYADVCRALAPLVLAYVKRHIPDHSWDTKRRMIKGTNGARL